MTTVYFIFVRMDGLYGYFPANGGTFKILKYFPLRSMLKYCITTMSAEPGRKAAYSDDYQRIGMEQPFHKIAMNLNIAASTAHQVYKKFVSTGNVQAKNHLSVEPWMSIQSY